MDDTTTANSDGNAKREPVKATILNVLIASPSDVPTERDAVESAIHEWNANHHTETGIILLPVRWETHSYPGSGDRPQAILNKQIVDSGHLLIGIFGNRLGTPTGKARSGTIEEIEEFRKTGRYVALYFSGAAVPRDADCNQLEALEQYKKQRQQDTLYSMFNTADELRRLVTQHLPKIVPEVYERVRAAGGTPRQTPSFLFVFGVPLGDNDSAEWLMMLRHYGPNPAYNCDIAFYDDDRKKIEHEWLVKHPDSPYPPPGLAGESLKRIHVAEAGPEGPAGSFKWNPLDPNRQHYTVSISCRDGVFEEKWEMTRVDGFLRSSITVERGQQWNRKNAHLSPLVFRYEDPEFVRTPLATEMPRRGKEKSFIQAGSLDINLKCPRRLSTRTVTYRLCLGSNCQTEAHKRTSGLGTSSPSISEMTRRDHFELCAVSGVRESPTGRSM
jgi:hypothetical protein